MKFEFDSIYKISGVVFSLVAIIFGAGVWATKIYYVVEQTRIDQVNSAKRIVESIDGQTKSIRALTTTLADHEARLRVNEVHIRDLREKVQK